MEQHFDFKRMVLGLPHSGGDYASVAFTAEFAELLGIDLVGLFVEDDCMAGLANLPCVRELQSLGGGWRPIDAALLAQAAMHRAAEARRLFQDAAKILHVGTRFDLAKGPIADAIGARSGANDIIVVIEPKNPAERVTHQFLQLLDIALRAPSAALLIPSRVSRRRGPVVAVAASAQDPSIRAAVGIARSTRERLIVLAPPETDEAAIASLAGASNVAVVRVPAGAGSTSAADLMAQLSRVNERFVVLSRAMANHRLPPQVAYGRGVPVLVT